jgi:parallel beta-helix repeat protein
MGAMEFTPSGSALSGPYYTLGSGGDYDSISTALNDLSIYGISGPVTFNILAGTYDEPVALSQVYGASATNTITFQSADANADSVIWENTANSSTTNYVLKLIGTDHITLKNITFKNQGVNYSQKIVLTGATDSVTIDSSKFVGPVTNSSSGNYTSIYGNGADAAALKIKNNTFTDGGGYAIHLSSNSPTGLEISGNTFTDTYSGIYVYLYDGVTIRGNTIKGSYMYDYGINLNYCDGANVIEDNTIYAPDMSTGIYLTSCQATSGNEASIANKLISVEDYCIYLYYYNYYQNM